MSSKLTRSRTDLGVRADVAVVVVESVFLCPVVYCRRSTAFLSRLGSRADRILVA